MNIAFQEALVEQLPAKFCLLVNARAQKGFDLVLDVAKLTPDLSYVVIASQSSAEVAHEQISAAGLKNITLIRRTNAINQLYARAHVVLVPSYKFLETFSRVCIEAQRHGTPVVGSDQGNVPLLLRESGISLPENARAWADCLRQLWMDDTYYKEAQRLALENSARYSKDKQRAAFDNTVSSVTNSMLIGIGSGIGNMLHAGPMIRNIARRHGAPVDLVVSQDHNESLFLLHNPEYVNSVHALDAQVLDRHYNTVFLTHCFGSTQFQFSCDRLVRSRDWDNFQPGISVHETIFNLEAAEQLLGFNYNDEDIEQHYISDIPYIWNDGQVVGIHGGSKPGYWSAKRWPGFPELVRMLKDRGFRVVCFGSPDEAVEGAEDLTGGSIEEMTRAMRVCSWFISNDSGVMNISNALGIPVLSIFAPTDVGTRKPLSARNQVVSARSACSPCEVKDRDRFKAGMCNCIADIDVSEVLAAFDVMCINNRKNSKTT